MICIAAGGLLAALAASQVTLAWTHSIEKVRWEEDWRIQAGRLVAVEARIRGSGAGMEIPEGARLEEGVWHYRPPLPPQGELRLSHSPHAGDYEVCVDGTCRPLADWLPGIENHATVVISACPP